jgi:hypothetical protein
MQSRAQFDGGKFDHTQNFCEFWKVGQRREESANHGLEC